MIHRDAAQASRPMLSEFAAGIHLKEASIRFFGFRLQSRMTVIRLGGGALWIHSPTPLDEETRRELDALGPVAFVVSPNKLHNQFLGQYSVGYPSARILAPPGLPERRPELRFDGVLGDRPEPDWEADLDQAATRGNAFFSEILFLHRSTGTLIVGDLIENIQAETVSGWGRCILKPIGGYGRPVASPEFRWYTNDADAAAESLARVEAWSFERIVLSHGQPIEENAKQVFRGVVQELLHQVRRRSNLARRMLAAVSRYQ